MRSFQTLHYIRNENMLEDFGTEEEFSLCRHLTDLMFAAPTGRPQWIFFAEITVSQHGCFKSDRSAASSRNFNDTSRMKTCHVLFLFFFPVEEILSIHETPECLRGLENVTSA